MAKKSVDAVRKGRHSPAAVENADVLVFERGRKRRGGNLNAPANDCKPFEALTPAQGHYYLTLKSKQVTFALGPAGTGKSHVAIARACELLNAKQIDQIIVTRPIQGVDEDIGLLPGTIEEKTAPYFAPIRKIMESLLGYGRVEMLIKSERILFMPLQFIRGHTFDNSFMLLDEAQNCSVGQLKAFLTRIGHFTTVAVDGDIEQIDIKEPSGLVDALERFKDHPKFGRAEFDIVDIIREDIVRDVIIAYRTKK